MTTTRPYDWGLDDDALELEAPADQIWVLLAAYDKAALAEHTAREELLSWLAARNVERPPAIGDLVTPWTLLRETDAPRYPIIDVLLKDDQGQPLAEPQYVIRLSEPGHRPEITIYGPGGFFVAARA